MVGRFFYLVLGGRVRNSILSMKNEESWSEGMRQYGKDKKVCEGFR